ncbi:conserved hypothetical protein [Burkholderia gladioli]|uniref:hypothetical protein n=1 Tax=Burkholderia gladioli TaxID=28095 RepID=UPI00163EAC5D|nr:hypothetical protein [Burkholderia gladioli]CAG9236226.1 conserved hypothetical protein [Burkholderia gladioli]
MNVFEQMRSDLNELVKLVRESERYCASVAAKPELASEESHAKELGRERRIIELSVRYGVTA